MFGLKRVMLEPERVMNAFLQVKLGRMHNLSAVIHELQKVIASRASISFRAFA